MEEIKLPASFYSASTEYNTLEKHVNAPYLRKTIFFDKIPHKSVILISGLGFYRLFINGNEITKGLLSPYISNPDDIIYYDEYDVSPHLTEGENVIGVILGNGFINSIGGRVWDFDKAQFRSSPKLAFSLICDGITAIPSAEGFKCHPSPILFDDERCGERYDASLEIENWNKPGFDDTGWNSVIPAKTPKGEKQICKADPIIKAREITPVSVTKAGFIHPAKVEGGFGNYPLPNDEEITEGYLFDFGVNAAGIVRLEIKGYPGQKVILQFGENVKNGCLDISNMIFFPRGYNQRCVFFCSGRNDVYEPSFCYFGFRYCLVSGITQEQAGNLKLTYIVCHSDIKRVGTFSCSNDIANRLYDACMVSDLANFYYFPTDCPHREKNGWTGDAALSAVQMMYNFEAGKSLSVWMDNIRKAQKTSGEVPGIIPTSGWGFKWGNGPAWDIVLTAVPSAVYDFTGDETILSDNANAIWSYMQYLETKVNNEGLFEFGLGDWCPVGGTIKAPLVVTDSITIFEFLNTAAYIFTSIGQSDRASKALSDAYRLRKAIRRHLIEDYTVAGECQACQAMALYYGIFDKDTREYKRAFDVLIKMIEVKGNRIDCGILGARVIFRLLADNDRADVAFKMITRTDGPSFGSWIAAGATSMKECFENTGSNNHHFYGDIAAFFQQYIAGLYYVFDRVVVSPCFVNELTYAEASCRDIYVKWERSGSRILLTVDCPPYTQGEISLREGYSFEDGDILKIIEKGTYAVIRD
ncbi:MAG: family 78 glycoside hydrolase catalytic domain [Eubacteriales bacterium]